MHPFKPLAVGFGLFAVVGALFVFPPRQALADGGKEDDRQVLVGTMACSEYPVGQMRELLRFTGSAFSLAEPQVDHTGQCSDRMRPVFLAAACTVGPLRTSEQPGFSYAFACDGTTGEVNAIAATSIRVLIGSEPVGKGPHVLYGEYRCDKNPRDGVSASIRFLGSTIVSRPGELDTFGTPSHCDTSVQAFLEGAGCTIGYFREYIQPPFYTVIYMYVCDGSAGQLNTTIGKLARMVTAP